MLRRFHTLFAGAAKAAARPSFLTPTSARCLSTATRKKVVIIGGSGFIGPYVAKSCIQDSSLAVQMASRSATKGLDRLQGLGNQILPPVYADVTDPASIDKACEGADAVVNLVGIMYEKPPKYTFENVQHRGAKVVAEAAKRNNSRLVHVSAIGADPNSSIPYARTKGLGERAVFETCPEATIIRPSLVFGKEDDFFNRFAKLAKILPFVPVFGGGHTKFQPVCVWDLAQAITNSIGNETVKGKIVEAGGPTVYEYRDMMKLMLKQAGIFRPIISQPWFVGEIQGFFLEKLPPNLFTLTRDQVHLLKLDNIVTGQHLTLQDVGILKPTPAEQVLHTYLRPRPLTTKNKRIHRMVPQDIAEELDGIRRETPPPPQHVQMAQKNESKKA
ncbi:hypothetical protein HK102_004698 [Quaeritorhiza haematococci]|nr:hypothetical protein HK102_004698 [Quaeritorhiza haematococci]